MKNTILVFGGSGYIGSTVCKDLMETGYSVINFDISTPKDYFFRNENYRYSEIDLSSDEDVLFANHDRNLFKDVKVKGAIHFAAFKSLPESVDYPFEYYENNIKSLLNALSICNSHNCPTFLFSSSAAVYADELENPVKEDRMNWVSSNPYGYTKVIGERIVEDCCREFGMKGISLRYFNPIGNTIVSKDDTDSLFGTIKRCVRDNLPLTIHGNDYPTRDGTCIRDYIDLRDLSRAHLWALTNPEDTKYSVFNVGTGKGTTVKEMAEAVKSLHPNFEYVYGGRRQGDSAAAYADTTKANKYGFECIYSLEETLETLLNDIRD